MRYTYRVNLEFLSLLPELSYGRLPWGMLAAILVSVVSTAYAFQIYRYHLHVNVATWAMVLCTDVLGLVLALSGGNTHPFVHLAWVGTDVLICIAAFAMRVHFKWTTIETLSLTTFIISLTLWIMSESYWSIFGYLIACFFTLLPQAVQYWHNRHLAKRSAWMWIMNSIALVMTILSLQTVTPEYSVVSFGLLLLNFGMVLIALR